jgi:signal peptidase
MRWAGRILLWLIIFTSCAILLIAVLIPRIAGATPYALLSGSMQPALPAGSLAVVRPVDADEIGVGSVITYQVESGKPTVVTHRVVAQGINGDQEWLFRTQGDANDVPDQQWVRAVQVRGKLWYAIPYLGYPTELLTGRQHQLLVYVVAAGLIGYASFMFGSAIRDRLHRKQVAT